MLTSEEKYNRAKKILGRLQEEYGRIAGPWEMWKIGRPMREIGHPARKDMQDTELLKGYAEIQHSLGLSVTQGIARMLDNPTGEDRLCLEALKGCLGPPEVRKLFKSDASGWFGNSERAENDQVDVAQKICDIITKITDIRKMKCAERLKNTRDQYLSHNLKSTSEQVSYQEVESLWKKIKEIIKLSSCALTGADWDIQQMDDFFRLRAKKFWGIFEKGLKSHSK
ncbi:MAG: hypothetical protein COA47_10930 [Robiginitomaculum sp.]|nr:MAG: hypothetical protein COA47_10930 [Robiginitomaculum sp.]